MTEHAHAVAQKPVQLHVPDGHEAVEPCVGHLVHDMRKPALSDLVDQALTRSCYARRKWLPGNKDRITALREWCVTCLGNAKIGGACRHGSNEFPACALGVVLDTVQVHGSLTDFDASVF